MWGFGLSLWWKTLGSYEGDCVCVCVCLKIVKGMYSSTPTWNFSSNPVSAWCLSECRYVSWECVCNVFPNEVQHSPPWWWSYMLSLCSCSKCIHTICACICNFTGPVHVYTLSSVTFNCTPFVSQMVHFNGALANSVCQCNWYVLCEHMYVVCTCQYQECAL